MYSTITCTTRTHYMFQPNGQKGNVCPGRLALQCHAITPAMRSCPNMPYTAAMGKSRAFLVANPFSSFTFGRAPALVLNKRSKGKERVMAMEELDAREGIPFLLSQQGESIASDILQLIGWTPLVEMTINASERVAGVRLVGKMETYQPLYSVKDRTALGMIEDAENNGSLSPGDTLVVEITSGNLGIGLASVAIQKGYKVIAVMPGEYLADMQNLMEHLGTEVKTLTGKEGTPSNLTACGDGEEQEEDDRHHAFE